MARMVTEPEENSLIKSLGLYNEIAPENVMPEETPLSGTDYEIVPNPNADRADLSELRGVVSGDKHAKGGANSDTELENLAELVPDIKTRRRNTGSGASDADVEDKHVGDDILGPLPNDEVVKEERRLSTGTPTGAGSPTPRRTPMSPMDRSESLRVLESRDMDETSRNIPPKRSGIDADEYQAEDEKSSGHYANELDDFPDSDHALDEEPEDFGKVPKEFINMSSGNSISTATQTHEVRMPMYLPTFKPATGCTNASDFIVRCFIARLRSGITVVKHGRSRWCKSRLRVLHIHPDGRSLTWKPAEGEPNSSKRPPKLDLSTCLEVRHAWSPDPQNPMYTGTPILRQKCEAANAHKSFALIFKQRTVDITAVTADQCKVLMEGFSALCFRLQVATLAGRGGKKGQAMPEEDGVSTTASATLTNSSTPRGR